MDKQERIQAIERIISNLTQEPHLTMATSVKMEIATAIEEAIEINISNDVVMDSFDEKFIKNILENKNHPMLPSMIAMECMKITKAISTNKEVIKIEVKK